MLLSTQAATMPSITVSNYLPLTRVKLRYEAFLARMQRVRQHRVRRRHDGGEPRLAGLHLSIEPLRRLVARRRTRHAVRRRRAQRLLAAISSTRSSILRTTTTAGTSEEFGNQVASFTSQLVLGDPLPVAVYFEYAGEDTSTLSNLRLGNSALSAGIASRGSARVSPRRSRSASGKTTGTSTHIYRDGLRQRWARARPLGRRLAAARRRRRRAQHVRARRLATARSPARSRLRIGSSTTKTTARDELRKGAPDRRALQPTVGAAVRRRRAHARPRRVRRLVLAPRRVHPFLNERLHDKPTPFEQRGSRLSLRNAGRAAGARLRGGLRRRRVEQHAKSRPTSRRCPSTVESTQSGVHWAPACAASSRAAASARASSSMTSTATYCSPYARSTIGGTCRSASPSRRSSAPRASISPRPRTAITWAAAVELKELLPSWSSRPRLTARRQDRARQPVAHRSAGRQARQLLRPKSGVSYLFEPAVLSGDQAPRSRRVGVIVECRDGRGRRGRERVRRARGIGEQRHGPLRERDGLGASSNQVVLGSGKHSLAPTSRDVSTGTPIACASATHHSELFETRRHRGTGRAPQTSARGAGSSADTALRRCARAACCRAFCGSCFEPTTRKRASGRASAMRDAQSRNRSRPRFAKSPDVTKPTSGVRGADAERAARAARSCSRALQRETAPRR